MRQRYRRRRDLLLELLTAHAPELRTRGVAAGLHVALDVPDESELVARAAERSLALSPLGQFWHQPRHDRQGVVLGYAAPPQHAYERTLAALADALAATRALRAGACAR